MDQGVQKDEGVGGGQPNEGQLFQQYLLVKFSICLLFKLLPERVGLHHHVGVEGLGIDLPHDTTLAMG